MVASHGPLYLHLSSLLSLIIMAVTSAVGFPLKPGFPLKQVYVITQCFLGQIGSNVGQIFYIYGTFTR